jgi:TPR repeat protein
MADPVKRPAHYTKGSIEVIDFIDQTVAGYADPQMAYYLGNILKYCARAPHKGNMQQDLEKAEFYLRRAINRAATLSRPVTPVDSGDKS